MDDTNPYLREPAAPRYNRRAHHHDYTRRARYMITLKVAPHIPAFSVVTGNPAEADGDDAPRAVSSAAGEVFEKIFARAVAGQS
ncbi:MAG: hypothetical protein K2K47_00805 [Duncaniella sp.]|nr:hypothetical protein [Duncaniella sp.]